MSPMERASRELDRMRVNAPNELERQALEYLNDLIRQGREYPDAHWLAWCQYKAVEYDRLQELYDSQP